MAKEKPKGRYWKGWLPIPDTCWQVETLRSGHFVKVGTVRVSGKAVGREMDSHRSIKGYEPHDLAQSFARRKFPRVNPLMVKQITCKRRQPTVMELEAREQARRQRISNRQMRW